MSVSIVLVRSLVEAVELAGVDGVEFLQSAGFDRNRLHDRADRVSFAEFEALQSTALRLTNDDAFGLRMSELASFVGFDVFASLIAHAATLREGIATYLRFHPVVINGQSASFHENGESATLAYRFNRGSMRSERFSAEMHVVGFLRLVRHFAGPNARVTRACFEHAAPHYASEYARIFEGTEHFEQPFTGVEFERALLSRSPLHADAELYAMLEGQAAQQLARVMGETSFAKRVLAYLLASPAAVRQDMSEVARHFGMSERSLRRRLSLEEVTYAELVDEALGTVAQRMLRDPEQSITSAAYAMGFSCPSAFHRAFKRWTGVTPKQYRERPPQP